MANTIQVQEDDDLKNKAEYDPCSAMSEEEMLTNLKESRKHAEQGKYRAAEQMAADIKEKYGL